MEEDLIRGAQAGDSLAFRALVERYTPVAWRVALALAPERSLAEDVIQDTWIEVWHGLPQFDIARPFGPWLLTIVANRCRMLARRRAVPQLALTSVSADELLDSDDGFEQGRSDAGDALQSALARLLPEQRRLLALRYSAELELAEIAALTAIPLSTVKSRLYRTLASLRVQLRASSSEKTATLP